MNGETLSPTPRTYRKRARARQEAETRQRIVDAAIDLHRSVGRPGATVQAIADKAKVGRVTVYRHFPDYDAILDACTSHYMSDNPPPGISQWHDIDDVQLLVATLIQDTYDYYLANEPMFTHGVADAVQLPFLAERMGQLGLFWNQVRDFVVDRCYPNGDAPSAFRPMVGLLTSFSGWQALIRQQNLSQDEAKAAAIATITGAMR